LCGAKTEVVYYNCAIDSYKMTKTFSCRTSLNSLAFACAYIPYPSSERLFIDGAFVKARELDYILCYAHSCITAVISLYSLRSWQEVISGYIFKKHSLFSGNSLEK